MCAYKGLLPTAKHLRNRSKCNVLSGFWRYPEIFESLFMTKKDKALIENVKRLAGLLLIVASLLPIAQCSDKQKEIVKPPVSGANAGPGPVVQVEKPFVLHVWRNLKFSEPDSWVLGAAFIWPMPILLLRSRRRWVAAKIVSHVLEIPLCGFTTYVLIEIGRSGFWQLLAGGYLSVVAMAIYIAAIISGCWRLTLKTAKVEGRRL